MPRLERVETERLAIRPIVEADLPALMTVNGDAEVTRFLPYATWASLDDAGAWLTRMLALETQGIGQQYGHELRATRRVIGTLLVFQYVAESQRAEIGYALARSHWRQGVMEEALRAACREAFGTLGLHRLEAQVDPFNEGSNAVLRRVGFRLEGRLRERWLTKGRRCDTHLYGLLASDAMADAAPSRNAASADAASSTAT